MRQPQLKASMGMLQRWPRLCQHVAFERPEFENAVLVVIVANCIVMMLDNPLEPEGSDLNRAIKVLEYIFTALFFIEFTVKIGALGAWNSQRPEQGNEILIERNDLEKGLGYFQNDWNKLGASAGRICLLRPVRS